MNELEQLRLENQELKEQIKDMDKKHEAMWQRYEELIHEKLELERHHEEEFSEYHLLKGKAKTVQLPFAEVLL